MASWDFVSITTCLKWYRIGPDQAATYGGSPSRWSASTAVDVSTPTGRLGAGCVSIKRGYPRFSRREMQLHCVA